MSALVDSFVEEARGVSVVEAAERLGVLSGLKRKTSEYVGPCPVCGGTDRFSVHAEKGWNCRGDGGGKDGIGLAAHVLGLSTSTREEFLLACAGVLGRDVPDGSRESDEARAAREARLVALRAANAEREAAAAAGQAEYREKERAKARGKWRSGYAGGPGLAYLCARLGSDEIPEPAFMRSVVAEPYWHGKDENDHPIEIYEGAAMVLPFVEPSGLVIGCHITWVDMRAGPKFRPQLFDGAEALPTKKMRGSKKGGLIPLYGFELVDDRILPEPRRWRLVIGEGIENTLAVARAEDFRGDTLYAAAGDLGNLAGPADLASGFTHPFLEKETARGPRKVRVAGPRPKPGQDAEDAFQVPVGVSEILLVADGDSERYATAAAMARAEARLSMPGRIIIIAWPPEGADFVDLLVGSTGQKAA